MLRVEANQHANTHTLVEATGFVKHFNHRRDFRGLPVGQRLVEQGGAVEHRSGLRHAGDIPGVQWLIGVQEAGDEILKKRKGVKRCRFELRGIKYARENERVAT